MKGVHVSFPVTYSGSVYTFVSVWTQALELVLLICLSWMCTTACTSASSLAVLVRQNTAISGVIQTVKTPESPAEGKLYLKTFLLFIRLVDLFKSEKCWKNPPLSILKNTETIYNITLSCPDLVPPFLPVQFERVDGRVPRRYSRPKH